jgi:hypothetical protein
MAEDHLWTHLEQAISFDLRSRRLVDAKGLGGTPHKGRIAGRLGRRDEKQALGGCWELRDPSTETRFDPTRHRQRRRRSETPGKFGRRKATRELEQSEWVTTSFRKDALEHVLVKRIRKGRPKKGLCVHLAKPEDGKAREITEIRGDGSGTEKECDVFRAQSTSGDGEGLRRLSVKPLRIVNYAQDGMCQRQLGQETDNGKAYEQAVGSRSGNVAERNTKSISMWRRQLFEGCQVRRAELLGGGEGELLLGLVPYRAEHVKTCGEVHGVVQESGLADARLPAQHEGTPMTGARSAQCPIEYLALALSPEQNTL